MTGSGDLTVSVLRNPAEVERIAPEWRLLWERCPRATTFQRPEWIISWMHTFQPLDPLIVEVRQHHRLTGIAPFLIYEDGSRRILGLMGGGVSDYLDILVEDDSRPRVLSAILDFTNRSDWSWDTLNLTDLSAASPLLTLSQHSCVKCGYHDVCTELSLPSNAEHIKEVIPAHKYDNLKNARSRLQRSGVASIELARQETLNEFLNALFELHENRWKEVGQSGVLADEKIQAFHRKTARQLLSRGILRFYGIRLDDRLIATLCSFFEREAAYCYLQGFDPAYASLSVGSVLLGTAICDALREGKKRVDFLRGQEAYKYSWGVKDAPTFSIQASRQSLASSILLDGNAAFRM
jgi:CelD/BcsL family acetyltransferase involved in cellulose biosynthesis